jgi:hypothetical protein
MFTFGTSETVLVLRCGGRVAGTIWSYCAFTLHSILNFDIFTFWYFCRGFFLVQLIYFFVISISGCYPCDRDRSSVSPGYGVYSIFVFMFGMLMSLLD